jgi:hypothetical protein
VKREWLWLIIFALAAILYWIAIIWIVENAPQSEYKDTYDEEICQVVYPGHTNNLVGG